MATETARSALEAADVSQHLNTEDRVGLLRAMLMMRGIEERAMTLYRQGKVPGSFYDGFGQEAVSAGAAWAMAAEDRLCILHRDLAAHIIRGVSPARILAQYMGRANGITAGRDGNVHFGDRNLGCVGMVSMLPDMMLVATGMAMAFKIRGERRCALTWFGDGSTSRGDFHEAMNWAGVQKLPVVFVLENNQYAYSTPLRLQTVTPDLSVKAKAYGIPGVTVDGTDVLAVHDATAEAVARARAGNGPSLIEGVTMRMHGHAEHDSADYVPREMLEEWQKRDPVLLFENVLLDHGVISEETTKNIRESARQKAIDARKKVLADPLPDPATVEEGVYED
jgi:TPP-dependent pyruvate/acetoin dehydrogenase alpha subunit